MRYILAPEIALRSWEKVPYAFYYRHERTARGLKKDEFELLTRCDGQQELSDSPLLDSLLERELIVPAASGERLTDWQRPMVCNNRYMPSMNWMITGKCNYNCIHCFNAADNAPLQSEFSWEEAERLMDEAQQCGINGFTITGGEPMAHHCFMDIVRGIYARGMYIFELNTNGFFLTQQILDEMKDIGCDPLMKISFDGVGFHDTMRGRKGAEQDAIRAIRLCADNGFAVKVQMNFNRANLNCIDETLERMDALGVRQTRVIRTTEAPRWKQNAKGMTFGITEYYDACMEAAQVYLRKPHRMSVDFWQFFTLYPASQAYTLSTGTQAGESFRETFPLCRGNRGMVAVSADGNVYPCLQMSGWFVEHGKVFGNVKTDGLKPLLQGGAYMDEVCATVRDLTAVNAECRDCANLRECCGGCRALAILTDGGLRGCDRAKCVLYREGYPQKLAEALQGIHRI